MNENQTTFNSLVGDAPNGSYTISIDTLRSAVDLIKQYQSELPLDLPMTGYIKVGDIHFFIDYIKNTHEFEKRKELLTFSALNVYSYHGIPVIESKTLPHDTVAMFDRFDTLIAIFRLPKG